jgi:hypothetical protein
MLRRLFAPRYSKEKLLLAFEYGIILSQVALKNDVEITPKLVENAEKMLVGEMSTQTASHVAGNMLPNILSAFELDITK